MKAKFWLISFLFISFFQSNIIAQHEAAVWFLTFPISPSQNAVGYTGTSLPNDDPYGFLLNPAQLGYTSQQNNFSFMYYPSKINLWGMEQFQIKGSAFNLGYNFKNIIGIPISLGFGFANQEFKINYGNIFFTGSDSEDKDRYNAYSIGLGIDYYIEFFTGFTYKTTTSKISNPLVQQESFDAEGSAVDFGILLNIPVLKLIDDKLSFSMLDFKPIKPFFNFSMGYSKSNIGDEIYYNDPTQSDPLPRTARFGYGISTGADIFIKDKTFRIIELAFSVDAEDLLFTYDTIYSGRPPTIILTNFSGYQSSFGDINIGRNIIQIKGDDNVLVHAGTQLSLA